LADGGVIGLRGDRIGRLRRRIRPTKCLFFFFFLSVFSGTGIARRPFDGDHVAAKAVAKDQKRYSAAGLDKSPLTPNSVLGQDTAMISRLCGRSGKCIAWDGSTLLAPKNVALRYFLAFGFASTATSIWAGESDGTGDFSEIIARTSPRARLPLPSTDARLHGSADHR